MSGPSSPPIAPPAAAGRAALFAAHSREALLDDLANGRQKTMGGNLRVAVFDPTAERIARARAIVERGKAWRGREGIWFSPDALLGNGGTLAFVFPGVDASFEPRVDDVAEHFGLPVPPCMRPNDLTEHGIGIVAVNRMLDRVLRDLGFSPAHVAGHSVGEWSGMIATGIIPGPALDAFVASLRPGAIEVPGVVFAAAGCGVEAARAALTGLDGVELTHDNCPHQVLFCGPEEPVDVALARLRESGVLGQKLPFRSGFHSPLFEPYLAPHRENFRGLPLQSPRATLWSATTCEPYPRQPDAIRALSIEHLIRPVRFRELIERMHTEGVRVFLQVGTGSLVNFIEDTLRGRPHLAISANVKERSGMDQLRRVLAALFVEGTHASRELVASAGGEPKLAPAPAPVPSPAPSTTPSSHPLAADFDELLAAVQIAGRDVMAAFSGAAASRPRERVTIRTLSLETMPELRDHSFVRQPPGWTVMSDWQPVVPMTTLIDLMIEDAVGVVPGRVAVAIEDVRAYRWLMVAPPVDVQVAARYDGRDRVHVRMGDYAEATVVLGEGYPPAPPFEPTRIEDPEPVGIEARAVYDERHLFHGPAFQGIVAMDAMGTNGIRGTLESGAARGALLDNAGQVYGYWVMARHPIDRMAMPVHIAKVRLYGPHPRPGEKLDCDVLIRSVDERSVVADVVLAREGRVWAALDAWEDRRFETDERLWNVMLWPEKNCLSEPQREGFVVFDDHYRAAPTRDRLTRRFLGEAEREQYGRQGPRTQRAWLAGRIAAKDAVRDLLWRLGERPLFPVEVVISEEGPARLVARTPIDRDVRIAIAQKEAITVAMAREGGAIGMGIERIEARDDALGEHSLSREERNLVAAEPRDEAWTRLWCAKQAAAKAAGTELATDPRRFVVRDRADTRLLVGDVWVDTKRHGDFILGWTIP